MKHIRATVSVGILLSLLGCQSTSYEPEKLSSGAVQQQNDAAHAVFLQLKAQYELWQKKLENIESLEIYSSEKYRSLQKEWREAADIYDEVSADPGKATENTSVFSSATHQEVFNQHISQIEQLHTALLQTKAIADEILADAIEQQSYLDQIDAEALYSGDYKRLFSRYSALFAAVEKGDIDEAQTKQVTFLNQANVLEQKVVLKRYVAPLTKELSTMDEQEFDEVAAVSFAKAQAEIMAAEQAIRANTRDVVVIKQAVKDARFELDHVKSVALEVKKLASIEDAKFEPVILDFENKLLMLSKALDESDYRDNVLRVQTENILQGIELLHSELVKAKLNHSESINVLNMEAQTLKQQQEQLKQVLAEKDVSIRQAEAEQLALSKQLAQSESHVQSLEALIEVYKQQLIVKNTEQAEVQQPQQTAAEADSDTVAEAESTQEPEQGTSEDTAQLESTAKTAEDKSIEPNSNEENAVDAGELQNN